MKNLTPIDLGNGVLVFKNVLDDPEKTYKYILDSKNDAEDPWFGKDIWHDWQPWGNYAKAYPLHKINNFISGQGIEPGADHLMEWMDVFYGVMKIYKEKYFDKDFFDTYQIPYEIPESFGEVVKTCNDLHYAGHKEIITITDIVVFETNRNVTDKWQMNIHEDVVKDFASQYKHSLNFNIYVNDDYEGGEIVFFDDKNIEKVPYTDCVSGETGEAWLISDYWEYKMKAGDGILFPTNIYHGVKPISKDSSKYYIRQFLTYLDSATYPKVEEEYNKIENPEITFEDYLKEYNKNVMNKRIDPDLFDSLDSIAIDRINDPYHKVVPCVIKSRKDVSHLI